MKRKVLKFSPSIIDPSIFVSYDHCMVLLQSQPEWYISATLHEMLYKNYERTKIFSTLQYFVEGPLAYLPLEKLNLSGKLFPYQYKEKYIKEIHSEYLKSELPEEVKLILLDQYSFLKEHSSILMITKKFAEYLYK